MSLVEYCRRCGAHPPADHDADCVVVRRAIVPERKRTDPGGFGDDETPTSPGGGLDPDALAMVRLFDGLKSNERRAALHVLQGWAACSLDRRVLVEALARELAKVHAGQV